MMKIFTNHGFRALLMALLFATTVITSAQTQPTGAINGVFSVSEGNYVYFSRGNLQFQASTNTWRFAEHQWDYVGGEDQSVQYGTVSGSTNEGISSTYSGWIDLFGWGTSGWASGAVCYQPWSTSGDWVDYRPGGNSYANLFGAYANADWGVYNAIINGGNQAGLWRTLTVDEWLYVLSQRNTTSGMRWARATVNEVIGLILFPDTWSSSFYPINDANVYQSSFSANVIDATSWTNSLEANGAVFFPAAGWRAGKAYYHYSFGLYHSASCWGNGSSNLEFNNLPGTPTVSGSLDRSYGHAVRLVRTAQVISYNVTTTANPSFGGSVSGAGSYNIGTECTLTATPNSGYSFLNWTVNGSVVSTNPTYSFTVWSDTLVVANFFNSAMITTIVNPDGGGVISGGGVHEIGETCTLHATANYGYSFENWTRDGTVVGTNSDYSFTVIGDATYVANFNTLGYTVQVSCDPYQAGTVTGGGSYLFGDPCTLTAIPAEGYYFAGWKSYGSFFVAPNPYSFSVESNDRITALFEPIPLGFYVGDGSSNNSSFLPGRTAYNYSLSQQIYKASEIGMPGGGLISGMSFFVSCENFTSNYDIYLLHTNKNSFNSDNDWIAVTPDDLVYSGQVNMQRAKWTTVTFNTSFEYDGTSNLVLVMDNNTGSHYMSSTQLQFRVFDTPNYQAISKESNNTNLDPFSPSGYSGMRFMEKNQVVFNSNPVNFTVSVSANPSNGGSVSGGGSYQAGQTCLLTATPNSGYTFANWTENGSVVSTNSTYSFTVTGSRNLVANFDQEVVMGTLQFDLFDSNGDGWNGNQLVVNYGNRGTQQFTLESGFSASYSLQIADGSHVVLSWTMGNNANECSFTVSYPNGNLIYSGANLNANFSYEFDVDFNTMSASAFTVSSTSSPSVGGFVSGGGIYNYGASCTLTAIPNAGYSYSYFVEQGHDIPSLYSGNPISFNVYDDCLFVAYFTLNNYTVSASANPSEGGSVSGGGTYEYGSTCTLKAVPNSGYSFTNWTENGNVVSTDTNYSFTVSSNRSLVANFTSSLTVPSVELVDITEITPYGACFHLRITNTGGSQVTNVGFTLSDGSSHGNGNPSNNVWSCVGDLSPNTTYTAYSYATNSQGTGYGNSMSFTTLPADYNYIVTTFSDPANGGTISGGGAYHYGETCTFTATPNTGYSFCCFEEEYNGEYCLYSGNPISVEVTRDMTFVAIFTLNSYTISASVNPSEGGSVSGGGTYEYGTTCSLTATANTGYSFTKWTKNGIQVSTDPTYSFTVTEDASYVAVFSQDSGGGFDNGVLPGVFSVGEHTHINFSQGNLQYQASSNTWRFAANQWDYVGADNANISQTYSGWIDLFGWGTSGWDSGNTYYHPWDSDNSDESLYGPPGNYDLTGDYANADWGVYNAICNGGDQTGQWRTLTNSEWNYLFNTRTTTSGIRYAKAQVNGIKGVILLPDDWNSSTYSLNNTNDENASFNSNIVTISQWSNLENEGAVFLPAAGYRYGTSVGNMGSVGYYWSASYYNSGDACDVLIYVGYLSASYYDSRYYGQSVRLVRPAENYSYEINATPNPLEGGTVSGGGTYQEGATCTLTATANTGYSFTKWTKNGSKVSTSPTYSFIVTEDATYVAVFNQNSYTISVSANPTEGGTVSGGGTYEYGTTCTLTATANTGYTFTKWTKNGSQVSTDPICSFTVAEDAAYVAVFSLNSYTISVSANPEAGGTVSGGGTYDLGDTCTLTATANPDYSFVKWTRSGHWAVSTNVEYSFVVTGNANYVAVFSAASDYYHWQVDAYGSSDIALTGVVQIDGIEQTATTLEVGAFHGEECVGRSRLYYIDSQNRSYLYMNLHGDEYWDDDDCQINFRLFDHVLNQELELTCLDTITWASNVYSIGSNPNPYVLHFTSGVIVPPGAVGITLTPGWNWISYLLHEEISLEEAFIHLVPSDGDMIKGQGGFSTYNASTHQWSGSISTLQPGRGYMYLNNSTQNKTFYYPEE